MIHTEEPTIRYRRPCARLFLPRSDTRQCHDNTYRYQRISTTTKLGDAHRSTAEQTDKVHSMEVKRKGEAGGVAAPPDRSSGEQCYDFGFVAPLGDAQGVEGVTLVAVGGDDAA